MIYTKEFALKLLDLFPEGKAVAVDECGHCCVYSCIPKVKYDFWSHKGFVICGIQGMDYPDWENSLVVRPKERWRPEKGKDYYSPTLGTGILCRILSWEGSEYDNTLLNRNLVFRTKQEAIEASKKMLKALEE